LRIGKYNQHFVDVLPMDKTPVSYLQSKNEEMPYQKIRNHLGKYGLGGHAHEILLKQCSGGQKARVVLARYGTVVHCCDGSIGCIGVAQIDSFFEKNIFLNPHLLIFEQFFSFIPIVVF